MHCTSWSCSVIHPTISTINMTNMLTMKRLYHVRIQACLKLLRCGATVLITSRFPADTAKRYAQQRDYHLWGSKVHVYGLDLRDLVAVELFCEHVLMTYDRLDGIVNNACQVSDIYVLYIDSDERYYI